MVTRLEVIGALREGRPVVLGQIQRLLDHAVRTGRDARQVAKEAGGYFAPWFTGRPSLTVPGATTTPGRPTGGTSYGAPITPGTYTPFHQPTPGAGTYQQRRWLATEAARAHGEGIKAQADRMGYYVRWEIAGSHPKTDICDEHASLDSGHGRGVYRVTDVPNYPSHPHCRCNLAVVHPEWVRKWRETQRIVRIAEARAAAERARLAAQSVERMQSVAEREAARVMRQRVARQEAERLRVLGQGQAGSLERQAALRARRNDILAQEHLDDLQRDAERLALEREVAESAERAARMGVPGAPIDRNLMRTTADYEDLVQARYRILADFDGLDLDSVHESVVELDRLAAKYPDVANRLLYVGTRTTDKARSIGQGYDWSKSNAFAHATRDGQVIGLNPRWYGVGKRDDLLAAKAQSSQPIWDGAPWSRTGNAAGTMRHEFGHHVNNYLLSRHGQAYDEFIRPEGYGLVSDTTAAFQRKNRATKNLSKYATTSPEESFAEAFSVLEHPDPDESVLKAQKLQYVKRQKALMDLVYKPDDQYLSPEQWRFTSDVQDYDERAAISTRILKDMERIGVTKL